MIHSGTSAYSFKSQSHQNWGMYAAEQKPGRDNINWFLSLSYYSPTTQQLFSCLSMTMCQNRHQVQDISERALASKKMSRCRRRLCKGISELFWHVSFVMGVVHQITNPSIPIGSHSVGYWEVSENKLLSYGNSWFYSCMVYYNILTLSRGTIFLRRWNSE